MMRREDRAKQFLPFDAMKGLQEAMRRKEEQAERVERIELGEEDKAAISDALSLIERGVEVELIYYHDGNYLPQRGIVTAFEPEKKFLTLEGERIPFSDLLKITIIS